METCSRLYDRLLSRAKLSLSQDLQDVELWWVNLRLPEYDPQLLAELLSSDELERGNRFRFQQDQQDFIAGRGILRLLLGSCLGLEPKQLVFSYTNQGKPELAHSHRSTVQFNLSHSNGFAAYAIAQNRRVGVDLEYIRPLPNVEQLAERFFSKHEHAIIASLALERREKMFFHLWTCKEAYLKATGEGLTALQRVELAISREEPYRVVGIQTPAHPATWRLMQFAPSSDSVAAIVIEESA